PVIEGARHPTGRFRQPLYGVPKDMVLVDMSSFASMRSNVSPGRGVLRGRLVAPTGGEMGRIVAYPSRAEIDSSGLQGQAQVLAYVDPVDAFFLEIQGSGVVHFSDGRELKLGYAAQNGHAYVPVGKFLLDRIPKERMSLQMIESHLRSLPTEEARRLMWQNPSYVFFQRLPNAGRTFLGTEVVAGRTIATDRSLFPKGTLAFLEFEKPIFRSSEDTEPASWQKTSRFVLDQDTGGAIRGPHRVDLFWGRGPLAKQAAGVMKGRGRLIYFVPRTSETPLRLGSVQGRP
ncbi:MAG: MltA domain-containing protein, partial [Bdellovibrionales bacterium]